MIPELCIFSENLYRNHFLKVALEKHHQLHTLMTEKQSTHQHHSACLKDSFLVCTRTAKRDNSFFIYGSKNLEEQPTVLYDVYYGIINKSVICNL